MLQSSDLSNLPASGRPMCLLRRIRHGDRLMEMDVVEFREQNNPLLLIWIRPRN